MAQRERSSERCGLVVAVGRPGRLGRALSAEASVRPLPPLLCSPTRNSHRLQPAWLLS